MLTPEFVEVRFLKGLRVVRSAFDLDQTRPYYGNDLRRRACQTRDSVLDGLALINLNIEQVHISRGQAEIDIQLARQIRLVQAHRGDEQRAKPDRNQDHLRLIARSVEAPNSLAHYK